MANTFSLSGVSVSQLPQIPREVVLTSLRCFLSLTTVESRDTRSWGVFTSSIIDTSVWTMGQAISVSYDLHSWVLSALEANLVATNNCITLW